MLHNNDNNSTKEFLFNKFLLNILFLKLILLSLILKLKLKKIDILIKINVYQSLTHLIKINIV